MTGNYDRTPIGVSLARIAAEASNTAQQQAGKELPCRVVAVSGQFVTVSFDVNGNPFTLPNITIPINTSAYDWLPIQVGDLGYTQAANVSLASVSGVSKNAPNLASSMNLTALVFQPISSKASSVSNPNQRVVQGPAGAVLQDTGAACVLSLTTSGITISVGSAVLTLTSSGIAITGNITATGGITAGFGGGDSVTLQHHTHPSNGAPPTPGT